MERAVFVFNLVSTQRRVQEDVSGFRGERHGLSGGRVCYVLIITQIVITLNEETAKHPRNSHVLAVVGFFLGGGGLRGHDLTCATQALNARNRSLFVYDVGLKIFEKHNTRHFYAQRVS